MMKRNVSQSSFDKLARQHVANLLIKKRQELGLDLETVSTKLNIAPKLLDQYEKGLVDIPAIFIGKLSLYYNVTPEYFFEDFSC